MLFVVDLNRLSMGQTDSLSKNANLESNRYMTHFYFSTPLQPYAAACRLAALTLATSLMVACGGGQGGQSDTAAPGLPSNTAPIASAPTATGTTPAPSTSAVPPVAAALGPLITEGWSACARENEICAFTGTREVRYGVNGNYITRTLSGGTPCTNAVFGDPIVGSAKTCAVASALLPPVVTAQKCEAAPPGDDFDPTAGFVAPSLMPTTVVTTTADSGPGSLREAIARGGVVGFAPSLADQTIKLASTIEISGSVTVDGSAAKQLTIDASQKGSAFRFNGDSPTTLRFFSLRIVGGRTTGSGGAITVNGGSVEVEVGGVRFESNVAGEGGAIRVGYRSPKVFIHDSTFLNNDGSIANNGFSGGAVSVSGGNLRVLRSRFEGNVGSTSGAIYSIHANPVVEDSVFINNRSSGNSGSGAFFADGGGPGDYNNRDTTPGEITLRRSSFIGNRGAGNDGGAGLLYAYPADTVTVERCVFRNNLSSPGRGGALAIHADKSVTVTQTAFVNNRASGSSGAIRADGSGSYTFENVLFSGNVADDDFGGALRMELSDGAKLRIASTTFVDNQAKYGNGAMWLPSERVDVRIRNSIVAFNGAAVGPEQVNFPVGDDGGNILWPVPRSRSNLQNAQIVDPLLGAIESVGGVWVRTPGDGSPAIGAAVGPVPAWDMRGAPRGSKTDVGSVERGARCVPG